MSFLKNLPGVNTHFTMLRLFTFNANYACKSYSETLGDSVTPSFTMNINIGCPPFQTIETNWDYPTINQYCPDIDPNIPCSYFDDG